MKHILNTLNSPATFILVLAGFCALAYAGEKSAPYDTAGLIAVIKSGDSLVNGKQWDKKTQAAALLSVWEAKP